MWVGGVERLSHTNLKTACKKSRSGKFKVDSNKKSQTTEMKNINTDLLSSKTAKIKHSETRTNDQIGQAKNKEIKANTNRSSLINNMNPAATKSPRRRRRSGAAKVATRRKLSENIIDNQRPSKNSIYQRASIDFWEAIFGWRVWGMLAQQQIKMRYRRSAIGPFWMTISMAVQMLTMGTLVSFLFNHSYGKFLPYICINFIIWSMLTGIIMETAQSFINNQGYIQQIKRPYFFYLFETIYRSILTFFHNVVVYFVVAIIFLVTPSIETLILLPLSLLLLLLNASWIGMLCAFASTRFRDVPQIIQALFGVLFWLTPIIYYPSQLTGNKILIVLYNPFFHMIDIVRQPLLGQPTYWKSWLAVTLLAIVGWAITYYVFAKVRAKVVYWL
ncbi:MAG: hypothetical protein CMM44_07635 [Rhodospirillaceae bacterium]|nr:hypothetical protein [Rhodospirillaceae bacterium]|tara:strand:- start:3780 stop:4943 length:1164 start_codon:yes stop_codon:yes gene_type:complete